MQVKKTVQKFPQLITKPSRFFAAVLLEQKIALAVLFVVVVTFLFCLIRTIVDSTLTAQMMQAEFGRTFIAFTVVALLSNCLYALCVTWLGKKFGGKATFKRVFLVGAYASAPLILLASKYTAVIGVIWAFWLAVIGLKIGHGLPTVRSLIVQAIYAASFALVVAVAIFTLTKPFAKHYPSDELVHKPAPDVLLKRFDGSPVMLSSLKGKSVVLLDFWATWCEPCRYSLPILSELARSYRDRGVTVFAIADDENPQTAKDYLQALKIELTGVEGSADLDSTFMVHGLPQTVIIDKSGIVQNVHVGASPREKEQLQAALDSCLAH
jgi:thiol-disulfide isomerase/thioredoxin